MFQWLLGRNNQEVDYWRVKFEQASNQLKKDQEDLRNARALIIELQKNLESIKDSTARSGWAESSLGISLYQFDKVTAFVKNRRRVLIPEILKHLGLERNKRNADSVGSALRSLGFKARMIRVDDGVRYGFVKE